MKRYSIPTNTANEGANLSDIDTIMVMSFGWLSKDYNCNITTVGLSFIIW